MKLELAYATMDGYLIKRGMPVWMIWTTDGGKTWTADTKPHFVQGKSKGLRSVKLRGSRYYISLHGDSRLFAKYENAKNEANFRNVARRQKETSK